jgi:hypothetical protein
VDVHVPQAWDEEAVGGVDELRVGRYPDLVSRASGRYATARHEDDLVATE